MSFLTKLLAPKQTAGRLPETEPQPEMVTLAFHQSALSLSRSYYQDRLAEANEALTAARAEAEANKVDADKYRRSRANLKQFRKEPV